MTADVTVRSARNWDEVRRTAVGAGRAFDGRRPEGRFFHERVVGAPALPMENTLLLFVDGDLASSLQVYERSAVVGGAPVTAGAIGNVFTLPEHRGEGRGTRLLEFAREFLAEKGYPFSMLLSGLDEFYGGAGWRACPSTVGVVDDPPTLASDGGGDGGAGEWRAFDPDEDLDAVLATYREGVDREGRFIRPRSLWEGWTFAPEKEVVDPERVRLRVRDGRVTGYLVRRDREGVVHCQETAFRGPADERAAFDAACWNELAASADRVAWHPPLPAGLRDDVAAAGGEVTETTDDHCMVQVHDARALDALAGVTTTAGLVEHLRDSDWYWSGVDAF